MSGRPRVLVFSSLMPLPVDRGDRNRLFHILELLSSLATVRLVAVDRAWEPPVDDVSALREVEVRRLPVSAAEVMAWGAWAAVTARPYLITRYALPRITEAVRRELRDFAPDVFWGYQAPSFPLVELAGKARRIIDLVDSPSRYAQLVTSNREVSLTARLGMAAQWRIGTFERRAVLASDVAIVNSKADATYLETLTGARARIVVLDNCVPRELLARPWTPPPGGAPVLLFVGNLAYAPNASAVESILRHILPRVRQRVPSARLVVCGARGEQLAREWGGTRGVEFRGFVSDLAAAYRAASVLLVPVPLAGGTQYKLLEGLAIGLPAVVSAVSAAITGVRHEEEVLVGDTPDEYANGVCRLLDDRALASNLSQRGRVFVEARHTWESKRALVERLVNPGPDCAPSPAFLMQN